MGVIVRSIIMVLIVALIIVVGGGILVSAVARMKANEVQLKCKENLKYIGQAVHNYCATQLKFPAAAIANDELPPEKRLSWQVEIIVYVDGQIGYEIDYKKAWDAEGNLHPKWVFREEGKVDKQDINGNLHLFTCPATQVSADSRSLDLTNYVGIAGLGQKAAELSNGQPQAGMFGYERKTNVDTLYDGNCMLVVETTHQNGPWTAGGFPTVRGLDSDGPPYVGTNGQFSSAHAHCSGFFSSTTSTNVLFANGSVRSITESIDPHVFEAIATISGHQGIERIGDD
jgi:hypothetical protein